MDLISMIFIHPLRDLYFQGPWVNGWGFWAGKDVEEICAYMNPTTSQMHWIRNINDCNELVERHFQTFLVGVKFVGYIVFLYKVCMALMLIHNGVTECMARYTTNNASPNLRIQDTTNHKGPLLRPRRRSIVDRDIKYD